MASPEKKKERFPPKDTHHLSRDEKLDVIAEYLRRLDRRDRWRAVGNTIRTMIIIIPLLAALGSIWYLYENAEELLQKSVSAMTGQLGNNFNNNAGQLLEEMRNMMQQH
ncbi:hypothetical protein COU77_00155 [Candidatus Peregrinibacteria bacterium CG10_big_fil_rev_8_21_14_0_10_49_16]|nr:MAG: hypothetical protein COW95_04770 [Candidatus Peregrinibacteria bacterium CG22_combo_CG10-13_8_21_14_all_49_11]PIR52473.1 MAG: hypothetical protein COU77_00155 [Candidatus Peregrinibacteria bacterium CG10_big_fil_rev_8_21_14_0_10_49_16]